MKILYIACIALCFFFLQANSYADISEAVKARIDKACGLKELSTEEKIQLKLIDYLYQSDKYSFYNDYTSTRDVKTTNFYYFIVSNDLEDYVIQTYGSLDCLSNDSRVIVLIGARNSIFNSSVPSNNIEINNRKIALFNAVNNYNVKELSQDKLKIFLLLQDFATEYYNKLPIVDGYIYFIENDAYGRPEWEYFQPKEGDKFFQSKRLNVRSGEIEDYDFGLPKTYSGLDYDSGEHSPRFEIGYYDSEQKILLIYFRTTFREISVSNRLVYKYDFNVKELVELPVDGPYSCKTFYGGYYKEYNKLYHVIQAHGSNIHIGIFDLEDYTCVTKIYKEEIELYISAEDTLDRFRNGELVEINQ